jgi:long-chain acyl-CoA synthetase
MPHPWLALFPEGLRAEIGPLPHPSLGKLMEDCCQKYHSRTAYISMGTEMTFGELETKSRDFAAYLESSGLGKGSRVALMMPNLLQFPIALFGALRAGCIIVNCSPLYTARELETQLIDAQAEAIIILENFAGNLQSFIANTTLREVIVTRVGDQLGFPKSLMVNLTVKYLKKAVPEWQLPHHTWFNQALNQGKSLPFTEPRVVADDLAFLQYTGGTTGVHKAAMLTHGNLLANMLQTHGWFYLVMDDGPQLMITALPLYHIFALTVNCLLALNLGVTSLLVANPRETGKMIKLLSQYRFTIFPGVNTLFNALLNHPEFSKLDFSHLKITVGGGMAVQRGVAERWKAVTGRTISQGYGLTETSPVATINPLHLNEYTGTIGLPLPSTILTIRNETGEVLPYGEVGEICIQGPQVMQGYWNRPDETLAVFHHDGALRTGDVGFMDSNGYTTIVDRKKDMILVSGYNVYPNEVEEAVAMHPWVGEVAAIGVEHKFAGEVVKVFVIKKDERLTKRELMEHCRKVLASHKVPRQIEFRTDLPRSNVGKILRRSLRDEGRGTRRRG